MVSMNRLDKRYQDLLEDILDNGVVKTDRTGTGTISVFGRQIKHKMSQGFPLLTTKKVSFKTIVTELLWFLKGNTNIRYLLENDCHIWTGDAYKRYRETKEIKRQYNNCGDVADVQEFEEMILQDDEFANDFGDLGPIYGKQWRRWREGEYTTPLGLDGPSIWKEGIDQIQNLINELKKNPDSRRLMVSAWNVGELHQMVLPPCHYGFQVYTRKLTGEERWDLLKKNVGDEKFKLMVYDLAPFGGGLSEELQSCRIPERAISLMWNQRSVDTFLGLPFNIASYGLLLEILGREVNMMPEDLIGNLGDVHLYSNHIEQAKEQIGRNPFKNLPTLNFSPLVLAQFEHHRDTFDGFLNNLQPHQILLEGYESHPPIKAPLSN
jgi:thymidylate synthase